MHSIKVDFSRIENLGRVLKYLKGQLPRSFIPWQLFKYIQQNILTRDDIGAEIFVDDLNEIKCLISLFSTPGTNYNRDSTENRMINVAVTCDQQHTRNILPNMLLNCVPWNQNLLFCASDSQSITPIIEKYIKDNCIGTYKLSTYIQFVLDRKRLLNGSKTNSLMLTISEDDLHNLGINIRPLSINDAEFIVELWPEKSIDEYSVAQTRFCIEKLPNLGAYRNNQLICWRLLQYDGSLDMVFTVPEARRIGLSSLLSVRLREEIFKIQEYIFGYTAPNNQGSLKTAAKMGFCATGTSDWIRFQPNKFILK